MDEPRIDHALSDGEDFELLLAIPPETAQQLIAEPPLATPLTSIGCFTESGLQLLGADGRLAPLAPRGYEHRLES